LGIYLNDIFVKVKEYLFEIFFLYSLGAVWQEIQALGNGTVEQIVQEGLALLLSGKDVLEQAKEIFKQLVKDLLAHSQTTSSLVSTAIAAVAELLKSKLTAHIILTLSFFLII